MLVGLAETKDKTDPANHIYAFAMIDAGSYKDQLADLLSGIEKTLPGKLIKKVEIDGRPMTEIAVADSEKKFLLGWAGRFLIIESDREKGALARHLTGNTSVSSAEYSQKLGKLPFHGDALVIYADFQTLGASMASDMRSSDQTDAIKRVLQQLGLLNVQAFISRSGFVGTELVADSLLMVPEPREGLFRLVKPVDAAAFDRVPAGVMGANLMNIDLAGLYDLAMTAVKTADQAGFAEMKETIADFEADVGIDIRRDLLENMSGQMISYSLPTEGAINPMGVNTVMIVKLRDAPLFEKSMGLLEKCLAEESKGELQIPTQTIGGRTFHVWMIPQFAMAQLTPCWTVHNGELILGLNVQSCRALIDQDTAADSLLKAEAFKRIAGDLPKNPVSLQYVDNKLYMQQTMQAIQQVWPVMVSFLQKHSRISLPMILPPASDLVKHMTVSIEYSWFDNEGLRCHTRGAMLNSSTASLAVVGTSVAVLLPSLERAREMARRAMSASNLRQIGLACNTYAQDHDGKLPADLDVLVKAGILPPQILESPIKPIDFAGPSYVYVPLPDINLPPGTILAYGNPDYQYEGTNVLYIDAAVSWQKPEEFRKNLAETYKRLNKPVPAVEFKGRPSRFKIFENLFKPKAPSSSSAIDTSKKIPFKCTDCGEVIHYTLGELQKMTKPGQKGPMMGPQVLDCPKCGKHTLTQAVECPKCGEVFVMQIDPASGMFNDKCPKCGVSYAKAWQEKYRKSKGK